MSAAEIVAAISASGSGADRTAALRHLQECHPCTRRVELVRRIAAVDLDGIAGILDEVDVRVNALLKAPRDTWWRIVRQPEYQLADVARRLWGLAKSARWSDPPLAVELLKSSTTILDSLPTRSQESDLRFEAWKFSSLVLRESARYIEAGVAIARAEEIAPTTGDPELASASIAVSRALLYAEPDVWQPDMATACLHHAEQVFTRRDPSRMYAVLTTRAFLLFRSGALADARKVFTQLVEASLGMDYETHLDALANLAWVRIEIGDISADLASTISHLLDENAVRGRTVQVARAKWMIGRSNVLRGRYAAGVEALRAAMSAIGDPDASIRIGMDAVRGLLLAERDDDALQLARSLAIRAISLDRREPSRRRALTAEVLDYAREAAFRRMLTSDVMDELSKYVDRITRQRPVDFVPPMPLTTM